MVSLRHVMLPQASADAPVIEKIIFRDFKDGFRIELCRFQILNLGDFTGIAGTAFIRMAIGRTSTAYAAEKGDASTEGGIVSKDIYLSASSFNFVEEVEIKSKPIVMPGRLWFSLHSVGAITDRLIVGVVIQGEYVTLSELEKAQNAFLS